MCIGEAVRVFTKNCVVLIGAVVGVAMAAGGASAQSADQDIRARVETPSPAKSAVAGPSIQYTSQRPPTNAEEITFVLNSLTIDGVTAYDQERLEAIYGAFVGKEVALAKLYEFAAAIQKLYRDDDFIFTRVIVPAQQIDGGAARLDVIEATIEVAEIEEPEAPIGSVKALAERIVSKLVGVVNPTGAALERVLFTLNEIPGVTRATAVPQAGKSGRGALSLYVNIERDPVDLVIYADNRQSRAVGTGILGVIATWNSYSYAGDTTSLALFNSFDYDNRNLDTGERNTLQLSHSRNVGTGGLRVEGRALFSRTRPGDDLLATGIEGEQILFGVKATQPLISSRKLVAKGRAEFEYSNTTTDVSNGALQVANDAVRVASLGLEAVQRDSAGYTSLDLSVRQGVSVFGASKTGDAALSRADGDPNFTLVRAVGERELVFNEELSLLMRASGQYAFAPLLSGEEFALGGTTFGRGFDPSQFTGDHGFGIMTELKYFRSFTFMEERFAVEPYLFGEMGYIYNIGDGLPESQGLASFGAGVRLFLPDDLALALEFAVPAVGFDENQLIEEETPRLFLNLTKRL